MRWQTICRGLSSFSCDAPQKAGLTAAYLVLFGLLLNVLVPVTLLRL